MSQTKVQALVKVLTERIPYCSGVCPVPEHQLVLYYDQGVNYSRVDFARTSKKELKKLSKACQPASFGFNMKDVLDESYRKAQRMNPDAFSTRFDPRSLGIHDIIERDLLSTGQAIELELYKLNVYEQGGFFKAHQDTPRGDGTFGTLVVVFPVPHEGGQLSFRLDERAWIVDVAEQFKHATTPSVYFVAFYGNVEHQVLPVTKGRRVTLTYNLHFRTENRAGAGQTVPRILASPFHAQLKGALIDLVNDPETLPNGGYLGFGLCHEYVYDEKKPVDSLLDKLKGSDAALANVCNELELPYAIRLMYAGDGWLDYHLLSRFKFEGNDQGGREDESEYIILSWALEGLTPDDAEAVDIIGHKSQNKYRVDSDVEWDDHNYDFMKRFYKDPVPQVLEVKKLSSVRCETLCVAHYGNDVGTDHYYGRVCMMVSLEPNESRKRL